MYWLMDKHNLQETANLIKFVSESNKNTLTDLPETFLGPDFSLLKIRGPMFARPNPFTQLLGLKSTEQYMQEFFDLERKGKPIVLDVDSHGGECALMFEFSEQIKNSSVPTISYTGGHCCSAGFLIHQSAKQKYAHKSAILGSLGVVGFMPDITDDNSIYSENAENKKPNKESVKKRVNELENLFIGSVASYNDMSTDDVIQKGNKGDTFTGEYAKSVGFVDETLSLTNLLNNLKGIEKLTDETNTDALQDYKARVTEIIKMGVTDPDELAIFADSDMSIASIKTLVGKKPKEEKPEPEPAKEAQEKAEGEKLRESILDVLQKNFAIDVNSVKPDDGNGKEDEPKKTQKELDQEWIDSTVNDFKQITGEAKEGK